MKSLHPKQSVIILTMLLLIASTVSAYPKDPDNAALLYYQAFLSFPKDQDQVSVDAAVDGTEAPSEAVRSHVKKCKASIKLALAAAKGKLQFALRNLKDTERVRTKGATINSTLSSLREEEVKPATTKQQKKWVPRYMTIEVIKGDKIVKKKIRL